MTLHNTTSLILETVANAQSLPDPTTVNGRTHVLVNTGTATATWSSTGATPFTENAVNVATITVAAGQFKMLHSNGTRWAVSPVASDTVIPAATVNPANLPLVNGFTSWNYDPIAWQGSGSPVSGAMNVIKLALPAGTVTNLHLLDGGGAGAGITNAHCALYNSAGALLSDSANLTAGWNASNVRTFVLVTPQVVTAGVYYAGFWISAATTPSLIRSTTGTPVNVNTSGATLRAATTTDVGLTTTAPATLGGKTASNFTYWVGAS